ncbi:MAG: hypothetical protein ACXW5U_02990 [Thermoanaerobaculia bacterium]
MSDAVLATANGERATLLAAPSHSRTGMSKHSPNQDFYKIAGRSQSDGPDRNDANVNADKHQLAQSQLRKDENHPAIRRAKRK